MDCVQLRLRASPFTSRSTANLAGCGFSRAADARRFRALVKVTCKVACLTDTYVRGDTVLRILNLGVRWRRVISCTHRESPRCSSAAPTGRVPGAHQLHPQAESPVLIEHYTGLELSLDPSTRQIPAPARNRTPYQFSSRLEPTRSSWFRFNHKPADSTRFSTHLFNMQSIVQHTTQSIHALVINIYTFVVCFSEVKKNSSK